MVKANSKAHFDANFENFNYESYKTFKEKLECSRNRSTYVVRVETAYRLTEFYFARSQKDCIRIALRRFKHELENTTRTVRKCFNVQFGYVHLNRNHGKAAYLNQLCVHGIEIFKTDKGVKMCNTEELDYRYLKWIVNEIDKILKS